MQRKFSDILQAAIQKAREEEPSGRGAATGAAGTTALPLFPILPNYRSRRGHWAGAVRSALIQISWHEDADPGIQKEYPLDMDALPDLAHAPYAAAHLIELSV